MISHRKTNALFYAFLALIFWLPLPLGSKHPWAISIAEVWCYLIAIIACIQMLKYDRPLPIAFKTARIVLILLLTNIIWVYVQTVPMPVEWLHVISPEAAKFHMQSGLIQNPITLDVTVTRYHLQTAIYLCVFFCLLLYLVDSKKRLSLLIYTVLFSALIQAMFGSFMILSGIEYSFFVSKETLNSHIGSATGTFTNRDHLAGYLEMALALGVGLMLTMLSANGSADQWKKRIRQLAALLLGPKARLRIILILLCLGLVLTHSRGGNIGFFASLGVAAALFMIFANHKPKATIVFLTSLIVLDIILIGSWVGVSKVMTRLEQTSMQTEARDDAYLATIPMIQDYVITGVGAGNYFNVFPAYKTPVLSGYWNHTHNDYLEIMADQGIIGFSLLAGVVLCSFILAIQTLRKRHTFFVIGMSFSSLMGISALLIHSGVDFNLQILANSSMFMVIIAIPFICRHLKVRDKKTVSPH